MTTKQLEESGKSLPHMKVRSGRFQISLWNFHQLLTRGKKDSILYIEQENERHRACVQFSTFNKATGRWQNQSIWCSPEDLRSLADAMDKYDEEASSSA